MTIGWVRAYARELDEFGYSDAHYGERNRRAEFRRDHRSRVLRAASADSEVVHELSWGDEVELPSGISVGEWTAVVSRGVAGFVATEELVEVAYVAARPDEDDGYRSTLSYSSRGELVEVSLLWGDTVQILRRDGETCYARARGRYGSVPTRHLQSDPLLEVYFIDVGQGDGTLVRTPDRRHLIVDGGLERSKQQTGKNAADFTDWKFFVDYGDHRIRLDGMVASHSDNDHYGGLHDLVRHTDESDRELDCTGIDLAAFYHPGLARWEDRRGVQPPHHDGLGPREVHAADGRFFVRLLGDREDAETATTQGSSEELSGPWRYFVRDVLANSEVTTVGRLGVPREILAEGGLLPELWRATGSNPYSIKVLGPVTVDRDGRTALPDFGAKSFNTNGHSVCLRIDYGAASVLLSGDLNQTSMDWLMRTYGDRMGSWACDVAKACHHGSHDISYRFLEAMRPAATVISSGDNEGYAHPRPEIVAASAVSGRVEIDRETDRLLTPLVYMTEVERSVGLGALDRLDFEGLHIEGPDGLAEVRGSILGRHFDEMNDSALLSRDEQASIDAAPESERSELRNRLRRVARERFRDQEARVLDGRLRVRCALSVPKGPLGSSFEQRTLWRSRVMTGNHYGLVNVRTDGVTVLCATLDETDEDWIIHTFPARTRPL